MAEQQLEITITLDGMTWGDYEQLQAGDFRKMTIKEQLDILDRFIVGGVRGLPISAAGEMMAAIEKAVEDLTSSGN